MLNYTLWYIFIGVIFSFVVDMSTEYARKKGIVVPKSAEWTWSTRSFAILIWPLGVLSFIVGFIYQVTKKIKKDE